MKFLVTFALCLIFSVILINSLVHAEGGEMRQKIIDSHKKCQGDLATAIDQADLNKYYFRSSRGNRTVPVNAAVHGLCVSKTLGWQNADGSVNKTYLKELFSASIHDSAQVDEILAVATAEKENDVATADHLFKTFLKYNRENLNP